MVSLRITSSRPPSTPQQIKDDKRWRRLYEKIVESPQQFGLPTSNPIPLCLQLACDETPAMYGAASPKTITAPSEGTSECKQVRVKAGDKRCCTATIVVDRAGRVPVVQLIWKGKSSKCHARVPGVWETSLYESLLTRLFSRVYSPYLPRPQPAQVPGCCNLCQAPLKNQ